VRGGLDDALDKLARRDELRRRAAHEATGASAGVNELVEAIAAVVGRHPRLGVTVGVEGDGDPMVLRFFYEEGQVQVTADNNLAAQPHADFDVVVGEPVEEFPPAYPDAKTPRMSQDDQDRFGPAYPYEQAAPTYQQPAHYAESDTAERRYGSFEQAPTGYGAPEHEPTGYGAPEHEPQDLGARMRDLGMASSHDSPPEFPPHPLAPTPPPSLPPQTTRRIDPELYRAPVEPTADEQAFNERAFNERAFNEQAFNEQAGTTERLIPPPPAERGMPRPLPEPIPLKVERPEETEIAARRLAALLRDDPTLLSRRPD
jgi:hypothetical protein